MNLDALLAELHDFLKAYPSSYWKRQQAEVEGASDTPMRTVKTILHTLTKLRGDAVLDHLSKVQVRSLEQKTRISVSGERSYRSNHGGHGGGGMDKTFSLICVHPLAFPLPEEKETQIEKQGGQAGTWKVSQSPSFSPPGFLKPISLPSSPLGSSTLRRQSYSVCTEAGRVNLKSSSSFF